MCLCASWEDICFIVTVRHLKCSLWVETPVDSAFLHFPPPDFPTVSLCFMYIGSDCLTTWAHTRIRIHIRTHRLALSSCPCLLLFPITNNSTEFPSLLSWGIFITAQSPCPEGLPALNCSTAVAWTLSSKTGPLFTNTRCTQAGVGGWGGPVSTSTAQETALPSHVAHLRAPSPGERVAWCWTLTPPSVEIRAAFTWTGEKTCWGRYPVSNCLFFWGFGQYIYQCPCIEILPLDCPCQPIFSSFVVKC